MGGASAAPLSERMPLPRGRQVKYIEKHKAALERKHREQGNMANGRETLDELRSVNQIKQRRKQKERHGPKSGGGSSGGGGKGGKKRKGKGR